MKKFRTAVSVIIMVIAGIVGFFAAATDATPITAADFFINPAIFDVALSVLATVL